VAASPASAASREAVCRRDAVLPVSRIPRITQYRSMILSTGRALLSACNVASRALYAAR
jgi:hypothetical protein